jgi:hypothetical protein
MTVARTHFANVGSATDALAIGGQDAGGVSVSVEKYNGSTWAATTALPVATLVHRAAGITTDCVEAGGSTTGYTAAARTFNGTAWSSITSMTTARGYHGVGGLAGSAGVFFSGQDAGGIPFSSTEEWNGSAWTTRGNMGTARIAHASFGSSTAAIAVAGQPTGSTYTPTCEKYN